jgi:hypothetical protein
MEETHLIGKRASWAMGALLVLSFALRLLYVERQSLRGDEALSVVYAQEPVARIVEITRFVSGHPPLFYTLLHFWQRVAGTSELAVRFFSLWWGVLAVALVYAFGRALFGPRRSAWAAALMAINPFWIMHAQDIRVYTMLAALALASSYVFWRAMACAQGDNCWGWWALYVVSGTVVVYAHYFGAFLILAHALFFAALRLRRPRRWWPGVLAFGTIGAALVPWLWYAQTVVTGEHGPGAQALSLAGMVLRSLITFGIGYWREPWGELALAAALGLLLGWGAWQALLRSRRGSGLIGLLIAAPLALVFALSRSRPLFRERYLIASAPAYDLLWGVGLATLTSGPRSWARRLLSMVAVLFVVGFNAYALARYHVAPAYFKSPDWRGAVSFVNEHVAPGDAVISNHQDQAVLYYYDAGPALSILPSGDDPSTDATRPALQDLMVGYDRVWLLPDTARLWDREGTVRTWLNQHCEQVLHRTWRDVEVLLYHTPQRYQRELRPVDARLGEDIRLLGYAVRDGMGQAADRVEVRPGEEVCLTLYWQPTAPLAEDYTVFAHLLDETGWLRGQQDNQPRAGTYPTRAWTPDEWVVDAYRIPVAADAPPGAYAIEVGMYRPEDGTRLPVGGTDVDRENRRVLLWNSVRVR